MRLILTMVLCQLVVASPVRAGVPASREGTVADPLGGRKIEFMLNLAEFVEWPAGYLLHPEQPLVLGLMGDDPFGETLTRELDGKRVNGRRVELRRFRGALEFHGEEAAGQRPEERTARRVRKLQELRACHILFLCPSERAQVPTVLKGLKGAPVLTVGDTEVFTKQGGMIGLVPRGGNLHLEINPEEARQTGLRISSKLLALADVVSTNEKEKEGGP